ncbi:MAG: hypothetical protein KJO52_03635 [Maribacter sp.]|nr:hypothetical protein [Maribacter sp.]
MGLLAQSNKTTVKEKSNQNSSYLLTDISYINDAVFMGRRDSIAAPYIFPSIGYYDASGFFGNASVSYLTSADESRVDLFLLSAGYLIDSRKWKGGISGTAYFFNKDSYNVLSETVGDITGILGYDLDAFEATLIASSYFNKESSADIFAGLMLDRTFYAADNALLINPSLAIYAGSQNFYEAYYTTSRLGNRKGQGKGTLGTATSTVTNVEIKEASEFNILNIELSLPLQYYHKQFIFSVTPTWAFPQSSATTITTEDSVFEEDLENVFYWSVGVSYWFYTKKDR